MTHNIRYSFILYAVSGCLIFFLFFTIPVIIRRNCSASGTYRMLLTRIHLLRSPGEFASCRRTYIVRSREKVSVTCQTFAKKKKIKIKKCTRIPVQNASLFNSNSSITNCTNAGIYITSLYRQRRNSVAKCQRCPDTYTYPDNTFTPFILSGWKFSNNSEAFV